MNYKEQGWYKGEGLLNDNENKNLFSYLSQSLFSGKHTTTYKYCFLKSILDNLYSFDSNYSISFEKIGETFVSIYWNMIVVYGIPQMPSYLTGERSIFERIIESMIAAKSYLKGVYFDSISESDRNQFLKKAIPEFSKNVIGAFYDDTDGMIYGFSKKHKSIWLNSYSHDFLCNNKSIIEQVNYYQWLKMVESILKSNNKSIDNLSTILECITKRNDLTKFKDELIVLGEQKVCFYCGKKLGKTIHLDHVIPWDFIKSDDIWNFVFSCPTCNTSKSNRLPSEEFINKLTTRNLKMKIETPDVNEIVQSAKLNGVKGEWKPRR